ncbi:ClpP/crotonase-like domain-containing protein [Pseudoneurospora amorphoporcata]|uniref:ClpP/crotonase-like domain-containing protein n=1 Tax=Pseudoneurospora amorphoporcata TaxID=241081 RepID=A0AAN6NL56_9PEZI|nr:ClpP/crotonase-like domain-containing protein [Pseudoneurospora amorphoporcata]
MAAAIEQKTLFTLPIAPSGSQPGGHLTCSTLVLPSSSSSSSTEPPPSKIYILTLTSPPDNRLTDTLCTALLTALDILEFSPTKYPPGVVITTSSLPKFFSNGLDLSSALSSPTFLPEKLYALFRRYLTYPMPTIGLLNGHVFAGGLMLAMTMDYRVMNPHRGFACVNELDFGVPLKPAMSAIFRTKCVPTTYKRLVLEAHRFGGAEAKEAGIVDLTGGLAETLAFVQEKKLSDKCKSGIYGLMKGEMYREVVEGYLSPEGHEREEERVRRMVEEEGRRREVGEKRVGEMMSKSKL